MTLSVHEVLLERGQTFAVAESLTGGALGAAVTSLPGVSATFRGGVIAYATELKAELLGVDRGLLADRGPVDPDVAIAMAGGVRDRLAVTWGLSTTGVAGPDPQDGHPPGEVYVGVAGPGGSTRVAALRFSGDRDAIRAETVEAALRFLHEALADGNAAG
ncbi:MAG TPA: CinA family protein [Actinomycetes bacterium]|nr:CinA family protein [Actinomycetes bacterium]